MDISHVLRLMMEKGASDMFLTAGAPPMMKVEGVIYPLGTSELTAEMTETIANHVMSDAQKIQFGRDLEMNFALAVEGTGRFRFNVFRQRGAIGLVIRAVRANIPTLEQMRLPEILRSIIATPRGLVLVVGSTGSGKSTTLAAMIDHRNSIGPGHILTIEDPIEFLHSHKRCLINQREVGMDTHAFRSALKNAMREAPDVVLIGEILDQETMESAIALAETGHLCLATLHANNADQTVDRILNFFPEAAHRNVLMNLSLNLRAVVSQRLVRGADGKRRPACEIMLNTQVIADLLRQGKVHQIKEAMEASLEPGMQTFDACLYKMAKTGQITIEEALRAADSRDGLSLKFRLNEGETAEHDPYDSGLSSPGAIGPVLLAESTMEETMGITMAEDPYAV